MSVGFFLWLTTLILGLVLKDGNPAWFGDDTATVGGWLTFISLALLVLNLVVVGAFLVFSASGSRRDRW